MPSAQDPFYVVKQEIQDSVSCLKFPWLGAIEFGKIKSAIFLQHLKLLHDLSYQWIRDFTWSPPSPIWFPSEIQTLGYFSSSNLVVNWSDYAFFIKCKVGILKKTQLRSVTVGIISQVYICNWSRKYWKEITCSDLLVVVAV